MPQTTCIFCQRAKPLITITKEHLLSQWIDTVLTPDILGPGRTFERTVSGPNGVYRSKEWPVDVIAVIEAPLVCGQSSDGCNEGWMGTLDRQVKWITKPMILGASHTLTPGEQLTIATWAAMKSMVAEYVWGADQPVASTQEDRTYVFQERRPPENMQVRIAAVESNGCPALVKRRTYSVPPRGASATEHQLVSCVTFALGCFVVQTFGGPGVPKAATRPPARNSHILIYPPRNEPASWPPAVAFDDESLDRFAHPLHEIFGD